MKHASSDILQDILSELKNRKALPRNIELSKIGPVHMASIYDAIDSDVITESVFTGMDLDPDLAVLKGLVEMVERKAFANGKIQGQKSCFTERSDGFAAFPIGPNCSAADVARTKAYHEAIERYVWATWWDNPDIGHNHSLVSVETKKFPSSQIIREISGILPTKTVHRIQPRIANDDSVCVVIYFVFLAPHGIISGGACGEIEKLEETQFRAACELARHALAVRRIKTENITPQTFYERRLAHFGMTEIGDRAARERLAKQGQIAVTLPHLSIDETIPHGHQEIISVHRCLFKDQPPFVGGNLERLCL
jgi:hypothetical protein